MKKDIIENCYDFLKYETPLNFDCGRLCNRCCCKDTEKGMILFPDEEKRFENNDDFEIIKDIKNRNLLFCNSFCERKLRPISCRIYPLFPYTYEESGELKQKIVLDLRGANSCVIIDENMKLQKSFIANVRKVGKILLRDEKCRQMLLEISKEIDDIIAINEMLR